MNLNDKRLSVVQIQSYLLCLWRERAALRRTLVSLDSLTVSFHWRSQVAAYQPQDSLVSYLSTDFSHQ